MTYAHELFAIKFDMEHYLFYIINNLRRIFFFFLIEGRNSLLSHLSSSSQYNLHLRRLGRLLGINGTSVSSGGW